MSVDPWTDPDPQPGDFDSELAKLDPRFVEAHAGDNNAALLVLGIPIAAIALLIRLSDPKAPVVFKQRRCGRHGATFELFKFRTMVRNAEELKE